MYRIKLLWVKCIDSNFTLILLSSLKVIYSINLTESHRVHVLAGSHRVHAIVITFFLIP